MRIWRLSYEVEPRVTAEDKYKNSCLIAASTLEEALFLLRQVKRSQGKEVIFYSASDQGKLTS